jgi:hypothetical protein
MKLNLFALLGVVLLAGQAFGGEQQVLTTQKDKENYSTGVEFVRNLKQQGGAIDLDLVIQGIKDGLTGEKLLMTEAEIRMIMAARQAGKTGQQEEMSAGVGIVAPKTMNAGREDPSATPKKQEPAQPRTDQAEQNDQLASKGFSNGTAPYGHSPVVQPGQSAQNQRNVPTAPISPNGTVISRRNQAKLSVAEMKAEMRASIAAGAGQ